MTRRPAAALLLAGILAALVVFTLLAAPPPGRVSEAQTSPGESVLVTAAADRVVIDVKGATVPQNHWIEFTIPGYSGTAGGTQACTIAGVDADGNSLVLPSQFFRRCENRGSLSVIVRLTNRVGDFRFTLTNVQYDSTVGDAATRQLMTLQRAASLVQWRLSSPQSVFSDGSSRYGFRLPGRVAAMDAVSSSATDTHAAVQLQAYIAELPDDLPKGSSVVLYLEDDYLVPDAIDHEASSVWFDLGGIPYSYSGQEPLSQPGRHYADDPIELHQDDYFGGGDDHAIRVYLPDLFPGKRGAAVGFQGAVAGQSLRLTLARTAGIRNPAEQGSYRIGYAVLSPDDAAVPDAPATMLDLRQTYTNVALSDDSASRGQTIAAAGAGFNDGVTATLYHRHYATAGRHPGGDDPAELLADGDPDAARAGDSATGTIMTPAQTCADIIDTGAAIGAGVVGSDHRVEIEFTIANPPFQPGSGNLLCIQDGEGHTAGAAVAHFNLEPSIRVTPQSANAGDAVTITGQDFPANLAFGWATVAGQRVTPARSSGIGDNGKGSVTFNLPGSIRDTVQVAACWGGADADDCAANGRQESANITVTPSLLTLSKDTVRPNESIIIRGAGFSTAGGAANELASITIDDVPLVLAGADRLTDIVVSNGGQFSAAVAIWTDADNNPALTPGEHRIKVTDQGGYTGQATITIVEPTVSVTPAAAGPRGYVAISGANWPMANDDGGRLKDVRVQITGGGIARDDENVESDANGRWSFRYRVPAAVAIPSTLTVTATYGAAGDITRIAAIQVRESALSIKPNAAPAGAEVVLNGGGFAPFESSIAVRIGPNAVAVPTGTTTNRAGELADVTVRIPALDAGVYTVQLTVGGTTAIAELEVLESARGATDLAAGLAPLGDNLVRVFYFNNAVKSWTFYDPRPDFDALNTQTTLAAGHSYWILVADTQTATLNGRARMLTCLTDAEGRRDCWNNIVW